MSENMKLFLEKVSADEDLCKKVSEEKEAGALVAIARELGISLTENDFRKQAVEELDDDELDVVAGGGDVSCACAMGGSGTKDSNDKVCACVLAGAGYSKNGRERCVCGFAGYGKDT